MYINVSMDEALFVDEIYVDGKKLFAGDCIAFDTDEGWVERFVRGEDGITLKFNDGGIVKEKIYGNVSIKWAEGKEPENG